MLLAGVVRCFRGISRQNYPGVLQCVGFQRRAARRARHMSSSAEEATSASGAAGGAGAGSEAAAASTAGGGGPRWVDIGANLIDDMYKGVYRGSTKHEADLDAVLARAWDADLDRIVITGTSLAESRQALEMANRDERLYCTVGVHPTMCSEFEVTAAAADGDGDDADGTTAPADPEAHLEALLELATEGAKRGKVVAIGECGLDYDRLHFCGKEVQQKYFAWHFTLAEKTGLPMFLHCRNTGFDMAETLKANRDRFSTGVVHSFDGSAEELDAVLAVDNIFVGVNGCSLKTAENIEVMKRIPIDRLVLETDAPWCGVRPTHAGSTWLKTKRKEKNAKKYVPGCFVKGRNEPCNLIQVAEVVAGARDMSLEELASQVYDNSMRLFWPKA